MVVEVHGHRFVTFDIVNFSLKINDGRYWRPNFVIWSVSYASAKILEREGASHHPAYMGNYFHKFFSLIHPVDEFSF